MFVKRIVSEIIGFLAKLSIIRRIVLLSLVVAVPASATAWIVTQDVSWAYVTLFLGAFAWAAFGTSVAQISRLD